MDPGAFVFCPFPLNTEKDHYYLYPLYLRKSWKKRQLGINTSKSFSKFCWFSTIYPPTTIGWKRLNDVSKYRCWWVILGKYNHLSNGGKIAEQQFDFVREEFNFYFVTILSFFTLLQFFLSSLCYNSTLLHGKAVAPVRHKQFQFSSPERRQK